MLEYTTSKHQGIEIHQVIITGDRGILEGTGRSLRIRGLVAEYRVACGVMVSREDLLVLGTSLVYSRIKVTLWEKLIVDQSPMLNKGFIRFTKYVL